MKLWVKIKKRIKRFIRSLFFTKEEYARFKMTDTFQMLRRYLVDRYFYKNIRKNSYATAVSYTHLTLPTKA